MLKHAESLFKAAGDRSRLRILKMLGSGPLCVCQMVEALKLSQSTVSKHLSILSGVGLIDDERRGKWTFYRLAKPRLAEAQLLLKAVSRCACDDPGVAKDLARVASGKTRSLLKCNPPRSGERRVAS